MNQLGQRRDSYRYVIAALTLTLSFSLGLNLFAVAPVLPLIQDDYNISRGTASFLISLVLITKAIFSTSSGLLLGHLHVGQLITLCWLLASAPALSALTGTFQSLLSLRLIYGVCAAILLPSLGPLLMQWFRSRELPLVFSLNLVAFNLGIGVSVASAAALAEIMGWQGVLSCFGCFTAVGALAWMVFGRTNEVANPQKRRLSAKEIWSVLHSRTTLLLVLADSGPYGLNTALSSWLPTYYHEKLGMSLSRAGFAVSLYPWASVLAFGLSGLISLRVRRKKAFLIVPGILMGFSAFGTFLAHDNSFLYLALLVLGLSRGFYMPILLSIPMQIHRISEQRVALMLGAILTSANIVGFFAPLTIGIMADNMGTYRPGFALWASLSWSLAVAGMLLKGPNANQQTS